MARISTYPVAPNPDGSDILLGTDVYGGTLATKNFRVAEISIVILNNYLANNSWKFMTDVTQAPATKASLYFPAGEGDDTPWTDITTLRLQTLMGNNTISKPYLEYLLTNDPVTGQPNAGNKIKLHDRNDLSSFGLYTFTSLTLVEGHVYDIGLTFVKGSGVIQDTHIYGIDIDTQTSGGGGINPTGFEALDEGSGGPGWRLIGRDPALFGPIGWGALDAGNSSVASLTVGATGSSSFNLGLDNISAGYAAYTHGAFLKATGTYARSYGEGISGQDGGTASGYMSTADGYNNQALGTYSIASGMHNIVRSQGSRAWGTHNDVDSFRGATVFGHSNTAQTDATVAGIALNSGNVYGVTVLGHSNITPTGTGTAGRFDQEEPVLIVGAGNYTTPWTDPWVPITPKDVLFLKRKGTLFLPSATNTFIDAATGDVVPTKQWVTGAISGGAVTFTFNQTIPATTWTISHNLGKFPSVTVIDSANTVVIGSYVYIDNNNITLNFSAAFAGKAYLN